MNPLIMCTAAMLNIFSMPAGNTVVGQVPYGKAVQIQDTSTLRDWVFIGKPGDGLPSPRGWVIYSGLGYCPQYSTDPNDNIPKGDAIYPNHESTECGKEGAESNLFCKPVPPRN